MSHENKRCLAWNYETTYYHIYPKIDRLDGALDPIFIEMPRSAQDAADVHSIVDALNRIADGSGGLMPLPNQLFDHLGEVEE